MQPEERIEIIKRAFDAFMKKMADIKRRQLILFDRVDKAVSEEKADEIRRTINQA